MIGMMRRLTQNKFFGSIFFGLVIVSMAVWGPGLSDIFSGGIGSNIIKAGERSISEQQLNRKFDYQLTEFRRSNPGNAITRKQAVEQNMLDQLYNVEKSRLVSLGYARTLGLDSSGQALLDEISTIDAFKNPATNEFDTDVFKRALANNSLNQDDFEADWQDRITINYMVDGLNASLVAPTDIARLQAAFDGEVRYIKWLPIEKTALPQLAEPTDEQLKTFYDAQLATFETPERRRLTILNLSPDDFLHQVTVSEEDIVELYEATKFQRLATPELRTFEEYIFPTSESAATAFAVIAVGGDIDADPSVTLTTRRLSAQDVAIEAFREELYGRGATVGSAIGPIEVNGTWMVGRLTGIEPGTPETLEESREAVRAEKADQLAELAYYTGVNELDKLIGKGLSIQEISAHYGASAISFAPVDRRALTQGGEFLQALVISPEAFTQSFERPQGSLSDRFDLGLSTVLIEVDEILPKSTQPLEDIRDRVTSAYKRSTENEALQTAANAVKALIDTGSSTIEAQAELYQSQVQIPERGLRRTALDRTLPQSVLRSAYSLGENETAVVQGRAPAELIIVQIDRVDRPLPQELDVLAPISKPKITEQIEQDILIAFEQDVQDTIKIEANDAAFAAYKRRLLEEQ